MTTDPTLNACCAYIWLRKNALMLQVSPFLALCRNTKSTFCLFNNVWDIYLSLDGHQAHIPPLVTPDVTALSNGQLWLLPISLFAHLLTHGVNICKTKRTAEEKKKKGLLFDLGSMCVGVCVPCTELVIESHPNSAWGHSSHWGVKWSGPGLDYKAGPALQ